MNALAHYIAALHQENLLEEAELARLVKLARSNREPQTPAWRRGLGGGARRLSNAFASAARSIDPPVEEQRVRSARSAADSGVGRAYAG
jgi:hypothetical protein